MDRAYQTLKLTSPQAHVALVCLNRIEVHNAINFQMMQELHALWIDLAEQDFRCVVLTGEGEKAFCAGADLKERQGLALADWKQQHVELQAAMLAMINCSIPLIAAVNGVAFGGGLELALACDFMYARNDTRFAFPEVGLGIMPGAMGTQNLPRACGLRRAKEIILTGQPFNSEQGYEWGIVNQLCQPDELLPAAIATAAHICKNAPLSVKHAKCAINHAGQAELVSGYQFELAQYNPLLETKDRVEGINAFNEKRQPEFQGE